jgi:hypothetical protein
MIFEIFHKNQNKSFTNDIGTTELTLIYAKIDKTKKGIAIQNINAPNLLS